MATPKMEKYWMIRRMEGCQQAALLLQAHVFVTELCLPVDLVLYFLTDSFLGRCIDGQKPNHLLLRRAALSRRSPRLVCSYDAIYLGRVNVGMTGPNLGAHIRTNTESHGANGMSYRTVLWRAQ